MASANLKAPVINSSRLDDNGKRTPENIARRPSLRQTTLQSAGEIIWRLDCWQNPTRSCRLVPVNLGRVPDSVGLLTHQTAGSAWRRRERRMQHRSHCRSALPRWREECSIVHTAGALYHAGETESTEDREFNVDAGRGETEILKTTKCWSNKRENRQGNFIYTTLYIHKADSKCFT